MLEPSARIRGLMLTVAQNKVRVNYCKTGNNTATKNEMKQNWENKANLIDKYELIKKCKETDKNVKKKSENNF